MSLIIIWFIDIYWQWWKNLNGNILPRSSFFIAQNISFLQAHLNFWCIRQKLRIFIWSVYIWLSHWWMIFMRCITLLLPVAIQTLITWWTTHMHTGRYSKQQSVFEYLFTYSSITNLWMCVSKYVVLYAGNDIEDPPIPFLVIVI